MTNRFGPWWPLNGLAVLAFAALTFTRTDADLWGHIRFGLDIWKSRELTSIDPYSFNQDRPWINHEWLSELVMSLAYALGGAAGIPLLKGVLAFVTFWMIWSALRGAAMPARIAAMVVVAAGTIHMTSSLRPQLWTFLLLASLLRILPRADRRYRGLLPVLFALWANVHGGWVVGLGVLGVWAAVEVWLDRSTWRHWVLLVAACVAATLITPYGWRLWAFIAETVRLTRSISEWQPLWTMGAPNWLPWGVAVVAIGWAAVARPSSVRLSSFVVLAMLAYSSWRVMRITSLFIAATAILLAPFIVRRWPVRLARPPATRSRFEPLVAVLLFIVLVGTSARMASMTLSCVPILGPFAPDTAPMPALAGAEPGRIVTHFNWGEYALWHLSPRVRVSIDGRRETVYSEARLVEHDDIVFGRPAGFARLSEWRAEYVWLPVTSTATKDWLAQNGYRIELETARSYVAVRRDLPPLRGLEGMNATPARCFPG